jgi:glycosyltransferase involved in cell wall biosynthesis
VAKVHLAIDASNIRAGGGVTHLVELLRAAQPQEHGFKRVIVWGGAATLSRIEQRPWLDKVHEPLLDRSLIVRSYWQRFRLGRLATSAGCDVLFVPGGSYSGAFRPFVTMSRNMLPFEPREAQRFGFSWPRCRYRILRRLQSATFRRARGVIFLTDYARRVVADVMEGGFSSDVVIPHGIDGRFLQMPREQKDIRDYSEQKPYRILYVSIVNWYKHQSTVAEAVAQLKAAGLPVQLDLIGPAYPPALKRLREILRSLDPGGAFIRYRGPVPHSELFSECHHADAFVFASSCETFGQVVTEAMASGLPIACSNRGPMPEVLGDAGLYFDPEKPDEIARALHRLVADVPLRERLASGAYQRARQYSWVHCADKTFAFLAQIAFGMNQQ